MKPSWKKEFDKQKKKWVTMLSITGPISLIAWPSIECFIEEQLLNERKRCADIVKHTIEDYQNELGENDYVSLEELKEAQVEAILSLNEKENGRPHDAR